MKKIRLRFAPSPTGYLHIGNLRTVLFGYLTAKSLGGDFILRIEDTDDKRKVEGAVEKLIDILAWCGIDFSEGPHLGGDFGPYIQSERQAIYDEYIKILIDRKEAYYCFCSEEKLEQNRQLAQEQKLPYRYNRSCRDLSREEIEEKIKKGEKYVIRQKMPTEGEIEVFDELRGVIKFQAKELEDHVLIKSNGIPTYQFANIVDDHLMGITHVTRAEEWIPSFPKNVLLYKSFGWEAPKFIHFPVILNKNGKGKLSKRQGDVFVEDYIKQGYLKEAIINFNALLGWHPEDDNEILSMKDLITKFDYKKIGTSPAVFDVEKLDYFNGYYIRQKNIEELLILLKPYLINNFSLTKKDYKKEDAFLQKVINVERERLKKLSDIEDLSKFFFEENLIYEPTMLIWKQSTKEDTKENLKIIFDLLEKIKENEWTQEIIENKIVSYLKEKEQKVGPYLWPMRVALTGRDKSPSPFEVASILGRNETIEKINLAIKLL